MYKRTTITRLGIKLVVDSLTITSGEVSIRMQGLVDPDKPRGCKAPPHHDVRLVDQPYLESICGAIAPGGLTTYHTKVRDQVQTHMEILSRAVLIHHNFPQLDLLHAHRFQIRSVRRTENVSSARMSATQGHY